MSAPARLASPAARSTTRPTASTARSATSASRTAASSRALPAGAPTLDARGMVVMPGGVDIHAHFASSSCNHARRLHPRRARGRSRARHRRWPTARRRPARAPAARCRAPSPPAIATRAWATPPCSTPRSPRSRRATRHAELDDTPCVDGGFFVLMGNDEYLLRQIEPGERDARPRLRRLAAAATGGYAIKIVNPGGVEAWKTGQRNVAGTRRPGGRPRGHAARHPRDAGRRRQRAPAAAPGPHPLQQPRRRRQRRRPRSPAWRRSRGAARTSPTCSSTATAAAADRRGARRRRQVDRVRQRPSRGERRTSGQVMFGASDDASPPTRRWSICSTRAAAGVDQHRHRAGDRLRHRAATPTRRRRRSRALQWAVGLELFLLSHGSLAGGALHRSPERRLVPAPIPR